MQQPNAQHIPKPSAGHDTEEKRVGTSRLVLDLMYFQFVMNNTVLGIIIRIILFLTANFRLKHSLIF